jgi:hypothetical protein
VPKQCINFLPSYRIPADILGDSEIGVERTDNDADEEKAIRTSPALDTARHDGDKNEPILTVEEVTK